MPATQSIEVNLGDETYPVVVGRGLLAQAGAQIAAKTSARRAVVISDRTVADLHLAALQRSLGDAQIAPVVAVSPPGEAHKNLRTIETIFDAILPAGLERSTPVIAFGGGVVGDIAGFVAATLLRGVPFIQIPTTLLAMVDASVGGKTGIDHAIGKNLIGAFHQPKLVLADPELLATLPEREIRGGLAECVKHDIIRDADGFARLEANIDRALTVDLDFLTDLVAHNVAIKARIVVADPHERGERAQLNFGHTFGHAIEIVSQFAYAHGEAVALGMCAAMHLARALDLAGDRDVGRVRALLARAGLPTGGLSLETQSIEDAMLFDKKIKAGRIRFVLPDGAIGRAVVRDDVPPQLVREAIERLREP